MDGLETRELRYFVAVAEELHYGRAAERLGMAQPPLSRAIRQVEKRVGVALLTRTGRGVALTAAGEVLLHESRKALDAVHAATARARRAGQDDRRLLVVMKPGGDAGLLPPILQRYAADPAALPVELVLGGVGEQAFLLRRGEADVGLLHKPYDDLTGFDSEDLLVEEHVAVVARGHPLAAAAVVTMAQLATEPQPRWRDKPSDDPTAPLVRDAGQLMQLIAVGRVIAVLPASARDTLRSDLTCVPIADSPTSTVSVAWPENSRSPAVAAFVRAAVAVAAERAPAPVPQ
jgi:DNA-binding transcriptional LysR family regulator